MIYNDIKLGIKDAVKSRDNVSLAALNAVLDTARDIASNKKYNVNMNAIQDDIVVDAIKKVLKQLNHEYKSLGMASEEHEYNEYKKKINVVESYMPEQLTRRQVEEEVSWILSSGNYETYGQRMKVVMHELGGRADTRVIRNVVNAYN